MEKDIARRIAQRVKGLASKQEEIDPNAIWQTVYGDMMTNMMLFFLMMFALNMVGEDIFSSSSDDFKKALTGEKVQQSEELKKAQQKRAEGLKDFFQQFAAKEKDVQLIDKAEGVKLRLPEPVLFDVGQAELKPEAKRLLHEFGSGLKNLPHVVVVEGHTDNVPVGRGPYKSNWELSAARAEAVVNHLIFEEGVPPNQLAVAGFGEHWPFVPNDSPTNRALNRRIELLVITDVVEK